MFHDRTYYHSLITIAVPIIIQQFIASALNMTDVVMIGQLGDVGVASVTLANQFGFVLFFVLFGVSSGSGAFTAQYWGKGDLPSIHKVMGIGFTLGLGAAAIFTLAALTVPDAVMRVYTDDPQVIANGAGFMRTAAFSYLTTALTFGFAAALRSTGNTRLPMFTSILAIALKTTFSFLLIFGKLGLPEMGIRGAALATVIARAVECVVLVYFVFKLRTPVAARLNHYFAFDRDFLKRFLKTSLPVVFNESLWSLGVTTYNAIYARIGTDAVAAINIAGTFESLGFVIFIGISEASGIMIGNKIGAGEPQTARVYGRRALTIAASGAVLVGVLIAASGGLLPLLYKLSPQAIANAKNLMIILGLTLWTRVTNMTTVVGVLRAGGDTRFGLILEGGSMWLVGVPTALLGAFVLHLPIYWVYLMIVAEELVRLVFGLWRFRSGKWIHNLTQPLPALE
jgi:putative MATE family efflux protein